MESIAAALLIAAFILIPFLFFGGLIFLVFKLIRKKQKQDVADMTRVAAGIGAVYTYRPMQSILDSVKDFRFISSSILGPRGLVVHLFELERKGVPWKVFDYNLETRRGTSLDLDKGMDYGMIRKFSTITMAELADSPLPAFSLITGHPSFLNKLLGDSGGILTGNSAFDETYTLDGDNEKKVYEMFSGDVAAHFTEPAVMKLMKGSVLESYGNLFALCVNGPVPAAERQELLGQAESILEMFMRKTGQTGF